MDGGREGWRPSIAFVFVLFVALFTDRVSPISAESRLYPVKIWFSGADTPAPGGVINFQATMKIR